MVNSEDWLRDECGLEAKGITCGEWLIVTDAGLIYMLYYRSLNINFYIKVEFEYPRNTKHLP